MSEDKARITLALGELRIAGHLYCAGLPGYPRNFTRDGFTYGIIANNIEALENQINYCAEVQGRNSDQLTGEECGKIHHELPGVKYRNRITTYNGCDTTALYLLSICAVVKKRKSLDTLILHEFSIQDAITYIDSHIENNMFFEDPKLAGADDFALRVTYWKDSVINSVDEVTKYPIVYTVAHFQNALALNQIGKIIHDNTLIEVSIKMFDEGMKRLWKDDHFITAIEGDGTVIDPPSTDSLHSLLYIPKDLLPSTYAKSIEKYSQILETKAGYRTGIPQAGLSDNYHTDYVWCHEQALLHCAARYHGLKHAQDISIRVLDYLKDDFSELINAETFKQAGNPMQLWSIGAYEYFEKLNSEIYNPFIPY